MSLLSASIDAAPANDKIENEIVGFVDIVEDRKVSGWAWNPADAGHRLEVEVRADGRLVAIARAERERDDLKSANVGDGRYGFVVSLDSPLTAEEMSRVSAYALPPDAEPVPLLNRAKVPPPRLISPMEGVLTEIRALRAESQSVQHDFKGVVQSAFGEMLRVLEKMAETTKALTDRPQAKPEDKIDRMERTILAKRLEALEGIALRLDETLGRLQGRLDVLEKDAAKGRVAHALIATIGFGTVTALLTAVYSLFR